MHKNGLIRVEMMKGDRKKFIATKIIARLFHKCRLHITESVDSLSRDDLEVTYMYM